MLPTVKTNGHKVTELRIKEVCRKRVETVYAEEVGPKTEGKGKRRGDAGPLGKGDEGRTGRGDVGTVQPFRCLFSFSPVRQSSYRTKSCVSHRFHK